MCHTSGFLELISQQNHRIIGTFGTTTIRNLPRLISHGKPQYAGDTIKFNQVVTNMGARHKNSLNLVVIIMPGISLATFLRVIIRTMLTPLISTAVLWAVFNL